MVDRDSQTTLIVAASTAVTIAVTIAAAMVRDRRAEQRACQIHRWLTRKGLTRSEYWGVYSDVLADLSGIDDGPARGSAPLP